jgi:hypothetical protein
MPWLWYCGVYSQNSEIYINIVKLCKTNITENQQTWREEHFDLKESLETMKKGYGTYGRKESWIVIRFGKYGKFHFTVLFQTAT